MPELTDIPLLMFMLNFSQFVLCGCCMKASCGHCSFLSENLHSFGKFANLSALVEAILHHEMLRKELERVKIWVDLSKVGGQGGQLHILEMDDFKFFFGVLWSSFIKCTCCKDTSVPFDTNCGKCIVARDENEWLDGCYDGSWPYSWDRKSFEAYLEGMIKKLTTKKR